jgi:vacuolar-type H+-ATPase subunit E/Vma4
MAARLKDGISRLPGKEFIAEMHETEARSLKNRIEELAGELAVKIETKPSPSIEGGVRISTRDERLIIDNSFSASLRQNENAIRREIRRKIFEAET